MEYTVYDLLKILWRKWYIIVIAVVVIPLLAILISRISYNRAVANYEKFTQERVVAVGDVGTTLTVYQYGYEVKDDFKQAYQIYAQTTSDEPLLNEQEYADQLFSQMRQRFVDSLTSEYVWDELEYRLDFAGFKEPDVMDENNNVISSDQALMLKKHFAVKIREENVYEVEIVGVEQDLAQIILAVYNEIVLNRNDDECIQVVLYQQPSSFELTRLVPTDNAVLANQVMAPVPEAPPRLLKTVLICAVFAAAFACFFVLLAAFVQGKKELPDTGEKPNNT